MSSNLKRYFVFWVAVEIVLMPCLPYHNIQINLITLTFDTRIYKIDVKIFLKHENGNRRLKLDVLKKFTCKQNKDVDAEHLLLLF